MTLVGLKVAARGSSSSSRSSSNSSSNVLIEQSMLRMNAVECSQRSAVDTSDV
jgi:hypothetical protein